MEILLIALLPFSPLLLIGAVVWLTRKESTIASTFAELAHNRPASPGTFPENLTARQTRNLAWHGTLHGSFRFLLIGPVIGCWLLMILAPSTLSFGELLHAATQLHSANDWLNLFKTVMTIQLVGYLLGGLPAAITGAVYGMVLWRPAKNRRHIMAQTWPARMLWGACCAAMVMLIVTGFFLPPRLGAGAIIPTKTSAGMWIPLLFNPFVLPLMLSGIVAGASCGLLVPRTFPNRQEANG